MLYEHDEDYVNDLTDRVFLIKRELEAGTLKIAAHLVDGLAESLSKIRLRPDGKVVPQTVDGRIRAMGVAVLHFVERNEIKSKFSLHELQEAYFRILFDNFGEYYQPIPKQGALPHQVANFLSKNEECVNELDSLFEEFYKRVLEFWSTAAEIGVIHLQDGRQLKANFAGDLFPAYSNNSVSIAGLYVDTIILPCPILRVGRLHNHTTKSEFCRLFFKHVLTCMTYKDIALEEIEPHIVLILPDERDYTPEKTNDLLKRSEPHTLAHAGYLFDRKFSDKNELQEFCKHLDSIDKVISELKKPDRLIFDTEWESGAENQLKRLMSDRRRVSLSWFDNHPGMEIYATCIGRMPQALSAKDNANQLGATPFINAQTSWLYYTWLLEYESSNYEANTEQIKDLHMVHALSKGHQEEFSWLGNIPADKIIQLRRKGLLEEVRETLSFGVDKLISSSPNQYNRTMQKVIDNIDVEFAKHQRFIANARKEKLKIFGLDVTPCIVSGVISIAAAYTGNVALGTIGAGLSMWGFPNIKDISTKFKERDERLNNYKNSATGIMFSHIK
ncbi:hypothetical protein [Enterobacter kobei]|uniref:hypothetical protein n=1 Tax=Enterobacter kobei TaxID=208224 RepID=UPI000792367D|nr:hypothetical protein [Enterobacter kobei]SAF28626.1 Uncharacterised protein [Enterobacter kobei]